MNCNQVFNILTRGPFPSGAPTDASVEIHLATCAGCRRLAEALRPALEVFQEAVGPEECSGLPGYWGELAPTATDLAVTTAPRRTRVQAEPAHDLAVTLAEFPNQSALWKLGACLLGIGMGLGILVHGLYQRWTPSQGPLPSIQSSSVAAPVLDRAIPELDHSVVRHSDRH